MINQSILINNGEKVLSSQQWCYQAICMIFIIFFAIESLKLGV